MRVQIHSTLERKVKTRAFIIIIIIIMIVIIIIIIIIPSVATL